MYYEKRKNNSYGIALILLLLTVIIVILISFMRKMENNFLNDLKKSESTGTDTVLTEFNLQDLAKNASYSIVGISKFNEKNTSVFVENSEEKLGIGSGIILTSNGFILSNYDTTGGKGETCFVTMKNGITYPAEVKWADSEFDISIIKIAVENLLFLQSGDSNKVAIGDKLYVLSNSTGYELNENLLETTVSKIKNTLKIVEENTTFYVEDIIKLNSNILPENNGGALLNQDGQVFGIASSRLNSIIPINRIKNILERLKETGEYKEAYLGIHGFDNNVIKYLLPDYSLKLGIYVEKIDENSPALEKIFAGDIITKIDDYELSSFEELSEYLYTKSPKEKVIVNIIRGTKNIAEEIILKEKSRQP